MVSKIEYPFCPVCMECGGKIELKPANGRTRKITKDKVLVIPDRFEIPTCSGCGDEIWSPELSAAVDRELMSVL